MAPWMTVGTRTHPDGQDSIGHGLAVSARPRRLMLGVEQADSNKINALNFLDPI